MKKQEMINFLKGHFRYWTMHSNNGLSSYARNIKLNRIHFPDRETENNAYDLLSCKEAFRDFDNILRDFDRKNDYAWQIGTNGRSGGYLVLMQGSKKRSEYKRICLDCGQKNYKVDAAKCGVCSSDNMEDYEGWEITTSGKSTDQGEDFEGWSSYELKERVKLVKDFDKTVDCAIAAFIKFCKEHKAVEKTIMVPKQVMVAEEA